MSDIIQDRVKLALNDDAISKNAVSSIAYISSALEGGDARTALTLLLNSGNIAERLRANRITVEHVRKAYEHLPGYSYRPIGHFIDERTIKILQVIAEFLSQYPDEFILSEKMLRAVRSEVAKRYKITLSHNDFIETLDRMVEARLVNKYMNKYLWISISIDSIMNLLAEYFK
jgi:cell division control protein 6